MDSGTRLARIDALLPQTQCRACGYDGCLPYAEAIAAGTAAINRCPPGGEATVAALAALLGLQALPLDPSCGSAPAQPLIALIEEARCIGCFKCVQACPVDAIVGAAKFMHTVISDECSGCELCVPVCPTDCIALLPRSEALPPPEAMAPRWRARFQARRLRLAGESEARTRARQKRRATTGRQQRAQEIDIAAAIARSRARRGVPPAGR